jgi:hypothetical protein
MSESSKVIINLDKVGETHGFKFEELLQSHRPQKSARYHWNY